MHGKKVVSAILAASVVVAVVSLGLRNHFGLSIASAASSGSDFSLTKATATITHETTNCSSQIAALASSYAYRPWFFSANATASANSSIISCNNPAWYSDSFDIRANLHVYDKKDFKSDITSAPLAVLLSPLPCSQVFTSGPTQGMVTFLPALTVKKRQSSSIVYQSEGESVATNLSGLYPAPPLFSPVRLLVNVAYQGKLGHLRLQGSGDLCDINNQPMSLTILPGILGSDSLQDAALNDTDQTCVDIGAPVFKTNDVTSSVCPGAGLLVGP